MKIMRVQVYVGPTKNLAEEAAQITGKKVSMDKERRDTIEIEGGTGRDLSTLQSRGWKAGMVTA